MAEISTSEYTWQDATRDVHLVENQGVYRKNTLGYGLAGTTLAGIAVSLERSRFSNPLRLPQIASAIAFSAAAKNALLYGQSIAAEGRLEDHDQRTKQEVEVFTRAIEELPLNQSEGEL